MFVGLVAAYRPPLDFGDDVGNVGLVERRKCEALLAEMVQGSADMNQRRAVDYQEAVVELVGHLDCERVAVLMYCSKSELEVTICDFQLSISDGFS